jgi:hypothetical protein
LLQVSMGAFIEWKGFMAASLCAVVFALVGGVLLIILYKRM